MDLAISKGCDGIEVRDIDNYLQDSGFTLTF